MYNYFTNYHTPTCFDTVVSSSGSFFFFSRRYNPWWVLACFTISFHILLSLHFSLQFLTFIFFKSSSAWSSHLSLGLPTGLDEHGSHSVSFLTVLVVFILITCATQRSLCVTWCFSDRASWIDYTLITNLMHWLLFIHKILFSCTCFEHQVLIFRRT